VEVFEVLGVLYVLGDVLKLADGVEEVMSCENSVLLHVFVNLLVEGIAGSDDHFRGFLGQIEKFTSNEGDAFRSMMGNLEPGEGERSESVLLGESCEIHHFPYPNGIMVILLLFYQSVIDVVDVADIPKNLIIFFHGRMDHHEKIRIFVWRVFRWLQSFGG
jgi:hypothetical protein